MVSVAAGAPVVTVATAGVSRTGTGMAVTSHSSNQFELRMSWTATTASPSDSALSISASQKLILVARPLRALSASTCAASGASDASRSRNQLMNSCRKAGSSATVLKNATTTSFGSKLDRLSATWPVEPTRVTKPRKPLNSGAGSRGASMSRWTSRPAKRKGRKRSLKKDHASISVAPVW